MLSAVQIIYAYAVCLKRDSDIRDHVVFGCWLDVCRLIRV